jgi:predicted glycosyltransferase
MGPDFQDAASATTRTEHGPKLAAVDESGPTLRVLFDIQHPAQVHLFKHTIWELQRRGHRTLVASREKELTTDLLDAYGIEHVMLTKRGRGLPGLVGELVLREFRLYSLARSFRPDVVVSRFSPPAVHTARMTGARNVLVNDTHLSPPLFRKIIYGMTLPFVDRVFTPEGFDLGLDAGHHGRLDFQELAYLHPDYFQPDPTALEAYGVDPDNPYFVVRLAAWDAYHDVGHAGLSPGTVSELLSTLSERGPVYVSSESPLPPEYDGHAIPVPPHLIHHLLYYATLYVGDSGTMATEAAVLGTPAVRANTLAGPDDESVFVELENRYGLLFSFSDERRALAKVEELLSGDIDRETWRASRDRLVEEQVDVTDALVEQIVAFGTEVHETRR